MSIKISQLDPYPSDAIVESDFFPFDRSSSLQTHRVSVQTVKRFFSTGSFSGSLTGSIVGSGRGSFTGSITGSGPSPQFVGTASWALNAVSSSYATNAQSANTAITASYALNASASLTGSGTPDYVTLWNQSQQLTNSDIFRRTGSVEYVVNNYKLAVEKYQAYIYSRGSYSATLAVANYDNPADVWSFTTFGDADLSRRGSLEWTTHTASNNLLSKQSATGPGGDPFGIVRAMKIESNGFFLWPLINTQDISRDGTFNIGVDGPNTDARVKVFVFSGSSVSNPQTYHLTKAIEVLYGSGSAVTTTFCVSSSGQVSATGFSGSTFSQVSFYGSASYALSSSQARTSSFMRQYPGQSTPSNFGYTASLSNGTFQVIESAGGVKLFYKSTGGTLYSASLGLV